jgi:prepilin-type N-terminal cleavage/methylation domain-containing protein/prepilin-type processing-associated H-X9-DG protein
MRKRKASGFTLVELLVVIGIIALLISILLPALSKARKQAMAVKCLANEHSLGQAILMYANDSQGAVVPCQVWGGPGGGYADPWAFLLVAGRYLPDPRVMGGNLGAANQASVFVCPSVRDAPSYDGTTTPVFNAPTSDGYDRRISSVVLPSSLSPTPDPINNGGAGACVIDIGYGINGASQGDGQPAVAASLPSQGISEINPSPANHTFFPVHRFSDFRKSSQVVLLFDGTEWNVYNTTTAHLWRISGARHGNWVNGPGDIAYTTGVCNILFMDGHAEGVNRRDLPYLASTGPAQIYGYSNVELNNKVLWNVTQ